MVDAKELNNALGVLSKFKGELAEATERCFVVFFDTDDNTSYHEEFKTEREFFERFEDTELDCEGFSWTLWNDSYIFEFGIMHHLIKTF